MAGRGAVIRRLAIAGLLALAWPAMASFDEGAFAPGAFSDQAFDFGVALVEVPDCTSAATAQAACVSEIEGAGFAALVVSRCSRTVEAGYVIATSPAAGTMAREGSAVVVRVASGPCGGARPYKGFGLDLRLGL